ALTDREAPTSDARELVHQREIALHGRERRSRRLELVVAVRDVRDHAPARRLVRPLLRARVAAGGVLAHTALAPERKILGEADVPLAQVGGAERFEGYRSPFVDDSREQHRIRESTGLRDARPHRLHLLLGPRDLRISLERLPHEIREADL